MRSRETCPANPRCFVRDFQSLLLLYKHCADARMCCPAASIVCSTMPSLRALFLVLIQKCIVRAICMIQGFCSYWHVYLLTEEFSRTFNALRISISRLALTALNTCGTTWWKTKSISVTRYGRHTLSDLWINGPWKTGILLKLIHFYRISNK